MNKKDKDFIALQKKWYGKLKEDGFVDVEGGVEGHLMVGPTPSLQLGATLSGMNGRLSRAKRLAGRPAGAKTDNPDHWFDQLVINYFDKGKTTYYDCAQRLATLICHTKLPGEMKFTWSLHSDGEGEDVISSELNIPRSRARKYLKKLRESMQIMIDNNLEP